MRGLDASSTHTLRQPLSPGLFGSLARFLARFFFLLEVHDAREPGAQSGRNVSAKGRIKKIQRIGVVIEK